MFKKLFNFLTGAKKSETAVITHGFTEYESPEPTVVPFTPLPFVDNKDFNMFRQLYTPEVLRVAIAQKFVELFRKTGVGFSGDTITRVSQLVQLLVGHVPEIALKQFALEKQDEGAELVLQCAVQSEDAQRGFEYVFKLVNANGQWKHRSALASSGGHRYLFVYIKVGEK